MERIGDNQNIVTLRDVFEGPTHMYVVQDLAAGGELFDVIVKRGELSEKLAAQFFSEAVRGVVRSYSIGQRRRGLTRERTRLRGQTHLHQKHICHVRLPCASRETDGRHPMTTTQLDIKPENLLLRRDPDGDEHVVLSDFGLSVYAGKGERASELDFCVGTPAYWAPEMVRRERFGLGVDIWALGCVLYVLLCGFHPFECAPLHNQAESGN